MKYIIVFVFFSTTTVAQMITTESYIIPKKTTNLYAGIEIGAKLVKISVLELVNAKKGNYNFIHAWKKNTSVGTGVSFNKMISESDIDKTGQIVLDSYKRLLNEFKINPKRIFVVFSSEIAVAKNSKDLEDFVSTLIQKKTIRIDFNDEAKFLIKGTIPVNSFKNALVLDIGGGNSKGGILKKQTNSNNYKFIPLRLDYGIVTLTEKVKNESKNKNSVSEYLKVNEMYTDTINSLFKGIINETSEIQNKTNIYISGGAAWSFITLSKKKSKEKFIPFTIQDVKNFGFDIFSNYSEFEKLAETDKEAALVLKTYSQLYLISGNNILHQFLLNIENIEEKKIFFVNQSYASWLKLCILQTVNHKADY